MQKKAKFITLEGIEGVGKSTQAAFISAWCDENNIPHILTREPGGTVMAEAIRGVLLQKGDEAVMPKTELLLMFAARAQHVANVIQPALARGQWVISDRFTDASFAYQGGGRGVSTALIQFLEQNIIDSLQPSLTFLLDAPPEKAFARIQGKRELDRFEVETLAFFNRVRDHYLERATEPRFKIIDAMAKREEIEQKIAHALKTLMEIS